MILGGIFFHDIEKMHNKQSRTAKSDGPPARGLTIPCHSRQGCNVIQAMGLADCAEDGNKLLGSAEGGEYSN
jgi:hypothetical protein